MVTKTFDKSTAFITILQISEDSLRTFAEIFKKGPTFLDFRLEIYF